MERSYKFPNSDTPNSLHYSAYRKKLLINQYDTENCVGGYYVFITIRTNKIKYDYYQVILTHDSSEVIIDW